MENKYLFSHNIYDVIDNEVQKYSSTAVHGGQSGSVQSSTTLHSDQAIWLKDVESGKERKLEFTTFNLAVRPGHRIVCIWHEVTGELEAVKNFSTDSRILGINNFSKNRLCTWFGIALVALLCGLVFLIPYLAVFICCLSFILGITPVCGLKTKLIPGYRVGFLISAILYVWIGVEIVEHIKKFDGFFQFLKDVFIFNFIFIFLACVIANNYVKNGRKELLEYLSTIKERSRNTI